MQKLLTIGLLSAALFTVSASQPGYARPSKVVRSPDPSVKCDKCREWVRVPSPGAGTRGQPSHYWKRAPICPECRQVANGEAAPAKCKTCGGSVHRAASD
jgi:hypothetical protein